MTNLFSLVVGKDLAVSCQLSLVAVLVVALLLLLAWLVWRFLSKHVMAACEFDGAELGLGNHRIRIRPNHEDQQIAFQLWTELSTRKLGLLVDEENDVIVEIYDSWYECFRISRELIKSIPVTKIRRHDSTKTLVDTAVSVLNDVLRPHLTRWHARFRGWYKQAREANTNTPLSPQEVQRKFPEYDALMLDMKAVNKKLVRYSEVLKKLVYTGARSSK